ncbi:MAG: carbohydrate ABC transporter permease [Clostridiales bacterium]|nr:carbohydrate ABC transporter permease [Clostridiales bacterium]
MKINVKTMKIRRLLLGSRDKHGLIQSIALYLILIAIGYVFLYPVLSMLVMSFQTMEDLLNTSVQWIPTDVTINNYVEALNVINLNETLWPTLKVTLFPALCQTIACMLTGYGLARFRFVGRRLVMAGVLLTFIIPFYAIMVPQYLLFTNAGMVGNLSTLLLPAITGQGIFSAVFVLIFRAFFAQLPRSLDEAARVDSAGEIRVFLEIGVPLSLPTIVTTFLFSFVWYWNDTYRNSLLMSDPTKGIDGALTTMLIRLSDFETAYLRFAGIEVGDLRVNQFIQSEAVTMAGTMLCVLPLLVMYFVLQKHFTESIERSGITGE